MSTARNLPVPACQGATSSIEVDGGESSSFPSQSEVTWMDRRKDRERAEFHDNIILFLVEIYFRNTIPSFPFLVKNRKPIPSACTW